MAKYLKLKEELKDLARDIRLWKSRRKEGKREGHALWKIVSTIESYSYDARHKHIAYCELRGTERHRIEIPAEDNYPNESYIEQIKEKHAEKTLCIDA